jgi:ABC-type multidrug transport system ATPase subunit
MVSPKPERILVSAPRKIRTFCSCRLLVRWVLSKSYPFLLATPIRSLLDLMTGRETLTMFAKLRGVPYSEVNALVEDLLERLTLTPHADKVTKAYSGGNKRKLSLGMALIGDPKVLLIDESSSGLDPLAKRKMWDLIEEAARSRSVILTTHSMQEAEALCTRVAIMVKGRYVCLGSVQHLKTKYLDGYSVDMFCDVSATNEIVEQLVGAVLDALPGTTLSERHGRFMRFEVQNVSNLGLGTCFRRLQELKNNPNLHVENYSVSQSSLEQVFVKLVNGNNTNADADEQAGDYDDGKSIRSDVSHATSVSEVTNIIEV